MASPLSDEQRQRLREIAARLDRLERDPEVGVEEYGDIGRYLSEDARELIFTDVRFLLECLEQLTGTRLL